MSVLFCHDHRFILVDGAVYSTGQFSALTFAAYEQAFGTVTIAARARPPMPGEDISKLSLIAPTQTNFIALPNLSTPRNLLFPDRNARAALRAAIAKSDFLVTRLPSEIGLLALREARAFGRRAIVEVVACVWDALGHHGAKGARLYAPVAYYRMRRSVARARYVHYVSNSFLQRRYPTSGTCVGVSDVEIERPTADVLDRRLASISGDRPIVFGMIAALFHRQKGVDIAIRALAQARLVDPTLTLRVLGPGDAEPWRRFAESHGVGHAVEFCGVANRGSGVLDWIDGIDVYIQASFQEGLPRALLEAMRQATPALASAAGGTPELLTKDYLHMPGDVHTLMEQMLTIRSVEHRLHAARTNFTASLAYSLDIVAARRRAFWSQVVAAEQGSSHRAHEEFGA